MWETYLTKYPKIDAAFFHNDDMALAAYNIMKARNRTDILIGGVDAMPPAIAAGRSTAACSQPCATHPAASMAARSWPVSQRSTAAKRPARTFRRASSPTVRSSPRRTRAGMLWMQKHFLI